MALSAYENDQVVAYYANEQGLQPCEAHLFDRYLKPGLAIFDIGVGGGRTTPYLSKGAKRYVGADYSLGMVAASRRRFRAFIPAYILNYIIGGGGFSSRLMEEVREKRGLAYSVYSYINPMQRSSVYMGGVATKTDAMDQSLEVIRSELEKVAKNGPTEEELADAKQYLTGSYALNFTSSGAISGQLLGIQLQDLGIDYIPTRNSKVEKVTIEDMKRVAKRLLQPGQLFVTVVGKEPAKPLAN